MISGPSGVGKGTIVQEVASRRPDVWVSVSYTTRPARAMERDGVHYRFVGEREFLQMRDRGELLEWAEVHGNLYGTPRRPIEETLARGQDVLLEIDVQGAAQVKTRMPASLLIFLEPPSMSVLEERLRKRRTEQEEAVNRRMAAVYDELRRKDAFDRVVVNDRLDATVEEVLKFMDGFREKRV